MLRLLSLLIAIGVAVAVAVWFANNPGDVIIQWLGWRVDSTVPVLLLAAVVVVASITAVLRLVLGILHVPGVVGRFRSRRALKKGLLALAEAEGALLTNDSARASKKAIQARSLLPNPQAAVLIQAEAALLRDDLDGAEALYQDLLGHRSSELAALRGLLALAERRHDSAKVQDYAARAVAINERAAWAVRPLFAAHVAAKAWDAAQKVLDRGRKYGVYGQDDHARLTATLLCAQAELAQARGETYEVARLSKKAVSADASFLPAVLLYAQSLAGDGNAKKAASLLVEPWRKSPHAALAAAYLALWKAEGPLKAVAHAETLAESNPEHLESRLMVAQAALTAELWGQARARLKPLADGGVRDRRVAILMARLEEGERGNTAEALRWFKVAADLDQASGSQAALWSCDACHVTTHQWSAICPVCDGIGTLNARSRQALVTT